MRDRRRTGRDGHESQDETDPLGRIVAEGVYGAVWLSHPTAELFDALVGRNDETSIQEARNLKRYFGRFAELGPRHLSDKMFKTLGRFKDGAGNLVQVYEFKAYQYRIYGVCQTRAGRPCFIGLATDESKKKEKANPRRMNEAAERSVEWV